MNPLSILKVVTEFAVSIGVSSIVASAVKAVVGPETKVPKKIAVGIGGFFLSSMVSDAVSTYAIGRIDNIAMAVSTILAPKAVDIGIITDDEAIEMLQAAGLTPIAPIHFDTEEAAHEVIAALDGEIAEHEYATVQDLFDLVGIKDPAPEGWGWKSTDGAILTVNSDDKSADLTMPAFTKIESTKKEN